MGEFEWSSRVIRVEDEANFRGARYGWQRFIGDLELALARLA